MFSSLFSRQTLSDLSLHLARGVSANALPLPLHAFSGFSGSQFPFPFCLPVPVPVQFMCLYLLSARATATCINYCPLSSSSPIKNSLTASSQRPIMSTPDCKGKSSRSHHCSYSVSICSSLSSLAVCNCLSTDRFLLSLLVASYLSLYLLAAFRKL